MREPAKQETQNILAACQRRGLLLLSAGVYGNVIRLLAPLAITTEQVHEGMQILEAALDEVQRLHYAPAAEPEGVVHGSAQLDGTAG